MKQYFILVTTVAILAACNKKQTENVPVLVEEETYTISEAVPKPSALPVLPTVKTKKDKTVNMHDSLKVDPKKGAVVKKKYKGTIPVSDGPGIVYDLVMYYQDMDGDEEREFLESEGYDLDEFDF